MVGSKEHISDDDDETDLTKCLRMELLGANMRKVVWN